MNRKQKKAKRLRATQHTKAQACYKPVQPIVFNRQSAEACLNRKDEFGIAVQNAGKGRLKSKICIIAYGLSLILLVGGLVWTQ